MDKKTVDRVIEKQNLFLIDKRRLEIDGVKGIVSFDEEFVSLDTVMGRLNVEGKEMRVEALSKESGKISIIGNINAVYYTEDKRRRQRK